MNVIDIMSRRPAATYAVFVTHKSGGEIEVEISGIADDERSRRSAAIALRAAAKQCSDDAWRLYCQRIDAQPKDTPA